MHGSLDPPDSASQTASRSVQLFMHSLRQRVPILYNGPPFPLKIPPWCGEICGIQGSLGPGPPTRVHIPNSISIGSAVFARLTIVTDRPTDRPRCSVCSNRPHLRRHSLANWDSCPTQAKSVAIEYLQVGPTEIRYSIAWTIFVYL